LDQLLEIAARLEAKPPAERNSEDHDDEYGLIRAISKIGGAEALAWLASQVGRTSHPKETVKGLLRFGPSALADIRTGLETNSIAPVILVEALASREIRFRSTRRVRPWITDEVLFSAVRGVVADSVTNQESTGRGGPFALAEFDLPAARELLGEIVRSPTAHQSMIDEARQALEMLDVEPFATEALADELDRIATASFVGEPEVRHLRRWSRGRVRAALIERLKNETADVGLLLAFKWFANPDDRSIFERFESDSRLNVADVAHAYLAGESIAL
jgi:hypothetical protein